MARRARRRARDQDKWAPTTTQRVMNLWFKGIGGLPKAALLIILLGRLLKRAARRNAATT